MFPEAGRATVQVLERLGHEVVFPAEQTCCGQMHVNSGYRSDGLRLARRFVEIFGEYDVVVSPSSSCVGNVRELYPLLAREAGDKQLEQARSAHRRRAACSSLSELLVNRLGLADVGASFPHRVAYHPTCHSLRVTHVGEAPLTLLRKCRSEAWELGAVRPCDRMLRLWRHLRDQECRHVGGDVVGQVRRASPQASGAEVCTAVDASCLLQIGGGLGRRGSRIRTMHLAEILAAEEA